MALKQVIVVRKDLKLKKGKLAVQVAHASILAYKKSKLKEDWEKEGQKKVALWCDDLKELLDIFQKAKEEKLSVSIVKDAGLTHLPKGTITCIGIGPDKEEKIDKITKKLKLIN
jgi:PTH2 family peptidyl-tRNA hydrolase